MLVSTRIPEYFDSNCVTVYVSNCYFRKKKETSFGAEIFGTFLNLNWEMQGFRYDTIQNQRQFRCQLIDRLMAV